VEAFLKACFQLYLSPSVTGIKSFKTFKHCSLQNYKMHKYAFAPKQRKNFYDNKMM